MNPISTLTTEAIQLLKRLIETPSLSREESDTAAILFDFLVENGAKPFQSGNNVWAKNRYFDENLPTILLNSHHDTVKPNASYTRDPFSPTVEGDQLFGLGSNDAGGPLVSLLATFLYYSQKANLPYNLIFAGTAEEEISGKNGIAALLPELGTIDVGIVGEPTQMQLAIAEKGLMVIDGVAMGVAGHAAREEGVNAIYEVMKDLGWFRSYQFEKSSPLLGPMKMSVTQIEAGTQHNVVPDRCKFVVDVRTNECYSNEEAFELIDAHTSSELTPRSFRLNSSSIDLDHPLVQRGIELGRTTYGSPTLSDQALIPFPTLKIGPGDSARSHTADEFILLSEIETGISLYVDLLKDLEIR